MKSLCVMPVYNQVAELPELLRRCRDHMPVDEFLIVDNGSDDGSGELIAGSGFRCIRLDHNYGIGRALRIGVEEALRLDCDVVLNIAGNGKMLPEQMDRILEPLAAGDADYVTGSRFLAGGESPNLPLFRRISIPLVVNTVVRLLFHRKITDATCGYRGFRLDLVKHPEVRWQDERLDRYQFEYYLYAKALKLKFRCVEVPISMVYPPRGRRYSKIPPVVGWYQMLEPWITVGLGIR